MCVHRRQRDVRAIGGLLAGIDVRLPVFATAAVALIVALALLTLPFTFFSSNFSVLSIDAVSWSATQVDLLLAVIGVVDVVVQGGLLAVLLPRIGERRTITIGIVGQAAGLAVLALVASVLAQPWILFLGVLLLGASKGSLRRHSTSLSRAPPVTTNRDESLARDRTTNTTPDLEPEVPDQGLHFCARGGT